MNVSPRHGISLHAAPLPVIALLTLSLMGTGCAAPFSDFQSARTVPPGELELTGSYSYVQAANNGEREKMQDEFGLQAGWGIGHGTELRARYHLITVGDETVSALGVGPKFGLSPDRVALYLPLGFGFGSDIEVSRTLAFQPTLLLTIPVGRSFEVTTSAKAHVWLNAEDADNLLAFNVGFGIGPDVRRWAIRPEVGVMIDPGEDGSVWQFGVAVSGLVGDGRRRSR
jgi:hypothetical protein